MLIFILTLTLILQWSKGGGSYDDVIDAQLLGSSIDPNFIEALCEGKTIGR